jgi:hypothetical protein
LEAWYVSLLGKFLESFYGSGDLPRTIWAQVRREQIRVNQGESSRRHPIGREKRRTTEAKSLVELEFWAMMPDRVREDQTRIRDGETESTVEVTMGSQRLKRIADGSIEVEKEPRRGRSNGDLLPNDFRRHFDRSLIRRLFASLTLEHVGACQVAGRDCVRIRAVPIPVDQIWPHWLPTEADEFEFAADLEFPSLLSIQAKLAGRAFETFEVVQVTFNGGIDESVFDVQPLAGKQTRDAEPVVQQISLEAAIDKVPFTVLLPKLASEFGERNVHYSPPRAKRPENLTVHYHGDALKRFWFNLQLELDAEIRDRLEWEEIEFAGRQMKLSDPEVDGALSVLVFNQEGTWVEIVSDLSRDELLKVAASFVAVRRQYGS